MSNLTPGWWKNALCYQIWPASFKDSNGDGLGDIPGILSSLDHLETLGIDTVWLSPMYASPQIDMGYDISDFEDVYPPYGTLEDMDTLITELHKRGIRLILDLVINHTSSEHAWFKESRKSKDNPKSDWYIWRAPRIIDGKRHPPTNWAAAFGGSAWEYVPERDEYYLHLFATEQPDLNWELETVRAAIYQTAIEFWLKKGIDGFRVDVVNLYSKDTSFPDAEVRNPDSEWQFPIKECVNGPRMHEWLKEIRRDVLDKYGDVMMVGELGPTNRDELLRYVSAKQRELSMVFDLELAIIGGDPLIAMYEKRRHILPELKAYLAKVQGLLADTDAWITSYLENHDSPRSISRFATTDETYHKQSAKLLAILVSSLSGTLFLFQGQEIGMTNIPANWGPEDLKDIAALNQFKAIEDKHPNDTEMRQRIMGGIQRFGRDNARTPVQWDSSVHAGFTTGTPWMRVNDNYTDINVAAQTNDDTSVLSFWRRMLKLRREFSDPLIHGVFEVHDFENPHTLSYTKESVGKSTALVVLNFSSEPQAVDIPPKLRGKQLELLITNIDKPGDQLSAWEGRIYLVR